MSEQQQPQRPIKYGDLFEVQGELAEKAVAPRDAAMMQTAENTLTGHTQKGGAAAVMQSAADKNERAGFVTHEDVTNVADDLGVSASEIDFPTGKSVITESVGGQVATRKDAEGVAGAEMRNDPYLTTHPTGVAASVAAAARINQQANMRDGNDENNNNN
ncbi:Late embryogenesis abundant protein 31 [Linum perenne]